jgi:hypothetical protein
MFGSMYHTVILEQMFGLFFLISSVIYLSRADFYRAIARNMDDHSGAVFFSSLSGLMLGIFLVILHNHWTWGPQVVVTIICWVILVRSIVWLAFPEQMVDLTRKIISGPMFYFYLLLMFVVGVYLVARGFYLPQM